MLGKSIRIWGSQNNLDLLLVNTPLSDYRLPHPGYTIFQPPIGLAVLASYLVKRGYRVGVWDADADKISPQLIADEVAVLNLRWVGFNTFTSGFEILKDIVTRLRDVSPETSLMLGGTHATTSGEDFLRLKTFEKSVLIRNDGEYKVEALLQGRDLREIPGISFADSGEIKKNPDNLEWLVQDLDNSDFEINRKFVPYDPTLGHVAPNGKKRAFIASSRGCPYECTYCASSRLVKENMPARYRSPENVVKEIISIIQNGVLDIKFNDELAWASEGRIKNILNLLMEKGYGKDFGLELRGNGRANIIAALSDQTLDLMRDAGVKRVGIGVEQGTAMGMARIKKKLNPEQVVIATSRLAKRGIPVLANFMFGLPGEDERETKATVALAKELILVGRKYGIKVEIDGYKYRPYPGTEIWEELIEKGYNVDDLKRVIQVKAETGAGSHLQVEPFLNLANINLQIERKHRTNFDNLMNMNNEELEALGGIYPLSLCLETGSSRGVENRYY